MTVDHNLTKIKIQFIISTLRDMGNVAKAYREGKLHYELDTIHSREFIEQSLEEMRNAYNTKHAETKAAIIEKLKEIAEIEKQNDGIFEFDNEDYKTALATIEAAKENIKASTIESFKLHFAGHHQLMLGIISALECHGFKVSDKFADYATAAEYDVEEIIHIADNLEYDYLSIFSYIDKLHKRLAQFAMTHGIELDEKYKAIGVELDDAGNIELARRIMGLA